MDLSSPVVLSIVGLSLQVSLVAMLISLPLAVVMAKLLARPGLPGKALLSALVHLPLVMPPVVTGYLLLLAFGRSGWIGSALHDIGLGISFSWTGAALAAGVMAFPLIVRPIRLAFEAQDVRLAEMASLLGASRTRRFFTISLPLAMSGIAAGLVLGFAKALGEFGATITFVSNIPGETQTLSLAIYSFLQSPSGDAAALTLVAISISISVLAVLVSEWFTARQAKRLEQ
ncbi:MAG: molybdate ABC transporter permease subunit [Ahrensia sp.]|nr:molybdate ABC transporter permease subunit [Ahrensia sp.]